MLRGSDLFCGFIVYSPSYANKPENVGLFSGVAGLGSLLCLYCILHPMRIRHGTLGNAVVLRGSALFFGFFIFCIVCE